MNQLVDGVVSFIFSPGDASGDFMFSVTTLCALKGPALQRIYFCLNLKRSTRFEFSVSQ